MSSVVEQDPFNEYAGDGVATVFPFEFQLINAGDLVVTIDGVVIPSSDFTLTGVGNQSGGDITFDTPPANGSVVLLSRDIALKRDTDYQYGGPLREATLDADFNRLWQALQGFGALMGGQIRAPFPEQLLEMPARADRINKVLTFDANGDPIVITPAAGSAASVLTMLGNLLSNIEGAALVAYNAALTYPSNTVGAALKSLLSGNFTSLINTGPTTLGDAPADLVDMGGATGFHKDAANNFGLGVFPSAWGGNLSVGALEQRSGAFVSHLTLPVMYWLANCYYDGTNYRYKANGSAYLITIDNQNLLHTWRSAPAGVAGAVITFTEVLRHDMAAGSLSMGAATGALRVGGHITRFESAEQNIPSGPSTVVVSHGGSRVPDLLQVVLRCKITEGGHAVGAEIPVVSGAGGGFTCQTIASATQLTFQQVAAGATTVIYNTANAAFGVNAANWKMVFKAHWL